MITMIKEIINQKKDFLEAAEIILEDGMDNSLDDAIILGEEADDIPEEDDTAENDDDKEEIEDKGGDNEDASDEDLDKDIMDQPIDGEDQDPASSSNDEGDKDILDAPIDRDSSEDPSSDMNNTTVDNELPDPVSNVTGEPVADDNLLTMDLDLSTNTPKDTLPIPPASAGDAVISDDMSTQRIDSGFGKDGDEPTSATEDNIVDDKVETDETLVDDILSEAITIADPPADENQTETPNTTADAATQTSDSSGTDVDVSSEPDQGATTDEPAAPDNDVTAAVKDKVAEADSPAYGGSSEETKEELMNKLSNITKNLEDAKRAVMSAI